MRCVVVTPVGSVVASFVGTTPFWYQGWVNSPLVPPEPPKYQP